MTSEATTTGPTGVEMEALVAASVAALTIYDMCKALERGMEITELYVVRKSGGRSGHYVRPRPEEAELSNDTDEGCQSPGRGR